MPADKASLMIFGRKIAWQSALFLLISLAVALLVNQIRADGLELPGNWSPEFRVTTPSGEDITISLEEARSLGESGEAVFLDARPHSAYLEGHIPGAKSFPWLEFDQYFERVMTELPDDVTLITYCDGETCSLSKDLALMLIDMGFPDVRVLVNGWGIWRQHQLPVETGA